jgi:hypothetical protein|tara:strand:+ start:2256 stop:2366 length:111 start_codon:yes stop_codon:yes gene_type:complete
MSWFNTQEGARNGSPYVEAVVLVVIIGVIYSLVGAI